MTAGEDHETRLRRLRLRSWRRGTREMDFILGRFADKRLAALDARELALYEALLEENDHDIFTWVSGRAEAPERYAALLAVLRAGPA